MVNKILTIISFIILFTFSGCHERLIKEYDKVEDFPLTFLPDLFENKEIREMTNNDYKTRTFEGCTAEFRCLYTILPIIPNTVLFTWII